jgi:hypothetical protein
MSQLASDADVCEPAIDGVLLCWSSSLSARGIHSVYVALYRVPRDEAVDLDGSEPNTTLRSGKLERAMYTPAVDIGGQGGSRSRQPPQLGCI